MSAVRQALGSIKSDYVSSMPMRQTQRRGLLPRQIRGGCWMVIDDIYGTDANEKITRSRAMWMRLVAEGVLEPLGFYGWSTWVGRGGR
jgi:hypothetical protein